MDSGKRQGAPVTGTPVALPALQLDRFSDEAAAVLTAEISRYAEDLTNRARHRTGAELVLRQDVEGAIEDVRPSRGRAALAVIADWSKQLGFLFGGFAAAQYNSMRHAEEIAGGSVTWLVVHVAAAAILLTAGAFLDRSRLGRGGS